MKIGIGFGLEYLPTFLGRAGGSPTPAPTAPVLALISVTGNAASFSIDIDDSIGAGDTVTLQVQATGGNWSSLIVNTVHTITSGEDAANEIDLTPAVFANGVYDARAFVTKASTSKTSAASNTVTFTISVVASVFLAMDMSDFRNTYILLN